MISPLATTTPAELPAVTCSSNLTVFSTKNRYLP